MKNPASEHEISESKLQSTRLSSREMYRLSRRIAVDWENLAAVMNIERPKRDGIRCNMHYNDARSKAEKILAMFNNEKDFSREKLCQYLKEIGQLELTAPVKKGEWRIETLS